MRWLLVAALLSGCATQPERPWIKAGGDRNDEAVCRFEAEKGATSSDPNAMVAAYEKADRRRTLMQLCMTAKGWTR